MKDKVIVDGIYGTIQYLREINMRTEIIFCYHLRDIEASALDIHWDTQNFERLN